MTIQRPGGLLGLALVGALLGAPGLASADELKTEISGKIQTDLRARVVDKSGGPFYNRTELPPGIERSQSLLSLKFKAKYGRFTGVASADMYLNGYFLKPEGISDLSQYNKIQPFTFEPQALYVEGRDLGIQGLDLRIGNQLVLWGVGDQFNPTNNLNADDLRDPLLFGKQVPNFMVKLDYWVTKNLTLTGVLVPVFRPAMLPTTAAAGVAAVDRLPFTNEALRHRVEAESAVSASSLIGFPTVVKKAVPVLPDPRLENMQFSFRMAGSIAEQDISLSYYNGRTDFPQPMANHATQNVKKMCDDAHPTSCVPGRIETEVQLGYPRMHVYGLNVAGQIDVLKKISSKLEALGYRIEAALVVPQRQEIKVSNDALALAIPQPEGEYDYDGDGKPGGPRPTVVEDTPFLKWVVGLDYTVNTNLYVNVQWVHGLPDEYGAGDFIRKGYAVRESGVTSNANTTLLDCVLPKDGKKCAREMLRPRLADYLAIVLDFKFLNEAALLRLFTLFDLSGYIESRWDVDKQKRVETHYNMFTKEGFSAVIYPEFNYNFGNGLELGLGGLLELGRRYTKFGDPAAGGSIVWTRGRYSF